MAILQQTFEKPETQKKSFLGRLFSLPVTLRAYKDKEPVINVKITGTGFERRRMIALINTIAKNSPTGRKILEAAAKDGYTFSFEHQVTSYGFCVAKEKVICLNPKTADSTLVTALVHEARHAQQHTQGISSQFFTYDVATELKLRRAMEADAQAIAAQTALEIRATTKNESVWNRFKKTFKDIAQSMGEPDLSVSADSVVANREKNMRAAFKGWFKDWRTVDTYEQHYLQSHLKQAKRIKNSAKAADYFAGKPFEGSMSSAEILKKICQNDDGKCYFSDDLNMLDRERSMCGICENTREAADIFFQKRAEMSGKAPDKSYKNLPSRGSLFESLRLTSGERPGKTDNIDVNALFSLRRNRER